MVRFLFVDKSGYCEQLAGTYAAMARAVGLPSRVTIGFTPGDFKNGSFIVTGRQAHAWPEVFISGYGWVAFEPTPGRGIPGAEEYTGVSVQQDVLSSGGPAPTIPARPQSATAASTTTTTEAAKQNNKADDKSTEQTNGT